MSGVFAKVPRVVWLAGVAGVLGAGVAVDQWLQRAQAPVAAVERAAGPTEAVAPATGPTVTAVASREADLSELLNRPLFDPLRGRLPPPPVEVVAPGDGPPETPVIEAPPPVVSLPVGLQLVGVIAVPEGGVALLDGPEGAQRLRAGDYIGDWMLEAVAADHVLFSQGETTLPLCLPEAPACTSATAP
jgi:hypothetical protein